MRIAARLGSRGVAVATLGPDFPALSGDEELQLFLDISDLISVSRAAPGRSVLAPLGSGSMLVYGPGLDLTPGGGDDQAWHLDASGGFNPLGPAPFWPQTRLPATDQDRGFAMSPGPDGAWGTGDETVVVHSGAVLSSGISASVLPATTGSPVTVLSRLIPVGPSWGLVQSPGVDGAFMTGDEQLVVVRY